MAGKNSAIFAVIIGLSFAASACAAPSDRPENITDTRTAVEATQSVNDKLVEERLEFLRDLAEHRTAGFGESEPENAMEAELKNERQLADFQNYWTGLSDADKANFAAALMGRPDSDILYLDDLINVIDGEALKLRLKQTRANREADLERLNPSENTRAPISSQAKTDVVKVTLAQREISGRSLPSGYYALTFDDGPRWSHYTKSVIDTLKTAGVPGNFFCLGNAASGGKVAFAEDKANGNTVNLHSWDHPVFSKLSMTAMHSQADRDNSAVKAASGLPASGLFRFPYGDRTKAELLELNKMGYVSVTWSIDTRDWAVKDPVKLMANITKYVEGSSHGIILMHDIHWQSSVVLPKVIALLKSRGATFVTLVRSDPVVIKQ